MKKKQLFLTIVATSYLFFISSYLKINVIRADIDPSNEECNNHEFCPTDCGCADGDFSIGTYVGGSCTPLEKRCVDDTPLNPYDDVETCTWEQDCTNGTCHYQTWTRCCNYSGCEQPTGTAQPTDPPAPTNTPAPTAATLTGSFMLTDNIDANAGALSCTVPDATPLILPSGNLAAFYPGTYNNASSIEITNQSTYSLNLFLNQTFDLYLTLPADSNYICSCPASIADNQKRCAYFNVAVNAADEEQDFYLMDASISNSSWFQVFDGGVFATNRIETDVPYLTCDLSASCASAIFAETNSNFLSLGFPFLASSDSSNVQSSSILYNNLDYIHTPDRPRNTDSYVISQKINSYDYEKLLGMAKTAASTVTELNAGDLNLNTLRSGGQLDSNGDYFFLVDGDLDIDENNQISVNSGENVSIFVNGNLTISDDGDNESKITQVASKTAVDIGGFLAFIVSGDIVIDGSVGRHLTVSPANLPVVSLANAQLEGVFLADGTLTIASAGSYPDHKFIGAGTFVGWTGVNLDRQVEDPSDDSDDGNRILNNNQALDNFIYRADLLANWPVELKTNVTNWREVNPQRIGD